MLASVIALRKAMRKHKIKHAVSFHRKIERAEIFRDLNDFYTQVIFKAGELETFHVRGTTTAGVRKRITAEFASSRRSLITNARCLTEGVDIPNIDCVLFADPKRSTIDIVHGSAHKKGVRIWGRLGQAHEQNMVLRPASEAPT